MQLKQFEPVDSFCEVSIEMEDAVWKTEAERDSALKTLSGVSQTLDEFCRKEVDVTLAKVRPNLLESSPGQRSKEISEELKDTPPEE